MVAPPAALHPTKVGGPPLVVNEGRIDVLVVGHLVANGAANLRVELIRAIEPEAQGPKLAVAVTRHGVFLQGEITEPS
eukprot:CAMPEP_0172630456 /NCGR_PEP_ID=MMETSP1068-20121228/173809_1 /TAXON_ID=35684 /ORGANISM="Pseudopedinella elastica, Strain CCMP716" /LENGTH=77 /DNA_ID=CAMNT_0013441305 /DNA_START=321 /DNA_END=551 /DNA_ORIENTATION=+